MLAAALEQMQASAQAADPDAWLLADIHLHSVLFEMANNQRAQQMVENLNDQWHRLRLGYEALQGRTQISIEEHAGFVTSILNGEGQQAESQMREHLARVRDDLIVLVRRLVLPFSERGF